MPLPSPPLSLPDQRPPEAGSSLFGVVYANAVYGFTHTQVDVWVDDALQLTAASAAEGDAADVVPSPEPRVALDK